MLGQSMKCEWMMTNDKSYHTPPLWTDLVKKLTRKLWYTPIFLLEHTDFKNVIFEKIHWAHSEDFLANIFTKSLHRGGVYQNGQTWRLKLWCRLLTSDVNKKKVLSNKPLDLRFWTISPTASSSAVIIAIIFLLALFSLCSRCVYNFMYLFGTCIGWCTLWKAKYKKNGPLMLVETCLV